MKKKMIPISHEEYLSGKYQSVSSSGGKHEARVWYKDNGDIDEESTYSRSYLAKKNGGSKSSSSKANGSVATGGILGGIFASSSSKKGKNKVETKSSTKKRAPIWDDDFSSTWDDDFMSNNNDKKEKKMSKQEELKEYIEEIMEDGLLSKSKKSAAISKAISLGLTAEDAEMLLEREYLLNTDLDYYMTTKRCGVNQALKKISIPHTDRDSLLKYFICIANASGSDLTGPEVEKHLKRHLSYVKTYYKNDTELKEYANSVSKKLKRNNYAGCIILVLIFCIPFFMILLGLLLD